MYKCEICGKEFKTLRSLTLHIPRAHHINLESYYCLAFNKEPNICPVCGKETAFKNYREGYREFCSPKCASAGTVQRRREIFIEKYGVDSPMKVAKIKLKQQKAIQDKYGVANISQVASVKEKKKQTLLKNYGVENPSHSEEIKNKRQATFEKRFGVSNPNKNRKVREKLERTVKERYGVSCVFANPGIKSKVYEINKKRWYNQVRGRLGYCELLTSIDEYDSVRTQHLRVKCKTCGSEFEAFFGNGVEPRCKKCYFKKSSLEQFVADILEDNNIEYIFGIRKFKPFEYDFYISAYNLAIETHGIYWHQEHMVANLYDKPRRYHLDKLNVCRDKGIKLLQFFEDEVKDKSDIVQSMIKSKLHLSAKLCGARECRIKVITSKEGNVFLKENHIHGPVYGRCVYLGAYYKDKLIGVMCFRYSNISRRNEGIVELDRFCSIAGYNIPGLASKMFRHFTNNYDVSQVVTYADLRFSTGNVYRYLGFELVSQTRPNYFYTVKGKRVHRYSYRKSELSKKLEYFDPSLTEYENMLLNGYDRVWDCGHLKFVWTR